MPKISFPTLEERKKRSISRLQTLLPFLQILSTELLRFGSQVLGFYFKDQYLIEVTDALRNKSKQDKLHKEGKSKAPFGYSFHNYGLAFDLAILDVKTEKYNYEAIVVNNETEVEPLAVLGDKWEKYFRGKWGGNFKSFLDKPHFEFGGNMSISEIKEFMKKNTLIDLDTKMRDYYFTNAYL